MPHIDTNRRARLILGRVALAGLLGLGGASAHAQAPVTTAPPSPAPAAATHQVTVLGLGLTSCEAWGQMRQMDAGNLSEQWVLGFLSGGAAFGASNYLGATSLADVLKLVASYCTSNPHSPLAVAAVEVAKELEAPMGHAAVHQ